MERGPGGEIRPATDLFLSIPPLRLRRGGWGVRSQRDKELLLRGTPYDGRAAFQSKAEQPADVRMLLDSQDAAESSQMCPDHVARADRFDVAPAILSLKLCASSETIDDL